ncbi:hypothetical protein VFPPC_14998 [Pochonia chlamydosporia 170]|uniref:Uncharacterized protein n=1 Tax=Pochonia chlamydosporia 170 TaxID=1380566 RepID=A0A179F2V9_METCM|nr:hypothetical protein VFPPC_14998 [Pochonia chlamydosporia 170]OAQ59744.1 hypothetical protein VFPPC_14998 [Pochonia chlamydosporia 170]
MSTSQSQPHTSSQIFQVCATAIVQSQGQIQQLRLYADTQRHLAEANKQEADSLRSELQQLRSVVFYVERERDGEINKCAVLQELIDTQRRIIRDYERERQGQIPSQLQGSIHYGPNFQQAFTPVPLNQGDPVGTGGGETGGADVGPME